MELERKSQSVDEAGTGRPLIGVTTSSPGGWISWWFNQWCLWRAGGQAVRLTSARGVAWDRLDGLLIGGGDDIAPHLYGGEMDLEVRIDPRRDALEQALLAHARDQHLPVLGICRGAQMINVFQGGSLYNDIYQVADSHPRLWTPLPRKKVHLKSGSLLQSIMGGRFYRVNCLHHQSIRHPGDGVEPVAWDVYGLVQAIEVDNDPPWLGVQWHPEYLGFHPAQRRLFRFLVQAAGQRRRHRVF